MELIMFCDTKRTSNQPNKISYDQLNAKCLIHISKFARAIYQINGSILKLKNNDIIEQITKIAANETNAKLLAIYTQLELEIFNVIHKSEHNNPTSTTSHNLPPNNSNNNYCNNKS